jgi:hypothetical protein
MSEHTCQNCKNAIYIYQSYCENCGENNPKYVKPKTESFDVPPPSNSSNYSNTNQNYYSYKPSTTEEGTTVGWFILGLFFPIVGFILYFSFKKDKPKASNSSVTGAFIGLFFNLFLFF